ncbi:MAG: hypothetical protein M2R45_03616 [Verrucomicrobia subdivision 3 bacterium]|nr:hypothetical protein [Limisphaerales bacterium]MCS1416889.1 hypothetical protein [Limisphaerales bacterium]
METDQRSVDIVVVGAGFGGSIMAMVCRRLGRSVILVERGKHPRFAIGESSTPLTNLLLEEIGERFNLGFLAEFSKWGSWQEKHAKISCGLKRGFSFFHHREGKAFRRFEDHRNELLVAASLTDALGDTHWYRPELDAFLVEKAVELGSEYWDESQIVAAEEASEGLRLKVERPSEALTLRARFVIDASGPRGVLFRCLNLCDRSIAGMPLTQALFGHFRKVTRCQDLDAFRLPEVPPYPIDCAAVHHVFRSGWFWELGFNNGIVSAGVVMTDEWAECLRLEGTISAWKGVIARFPSLQQIFANAVVDSQFFYQRRVSFFSDLLHGRGWALLPSAAAVIDPLFSTGFPLNLLGIVRLGLAIERFFDLPGFLGQMERYSEVTRDEACRVGRLVGVAYQAMGSPKVFNAVSYLYFAAVSFEETRRRLKRVPIDNGFLLGSHRCFRDRLDRCLDQISRQLAQGSLRQEQEDQLVNHVIETVEPFNVIGIGRRNAQNWYPVRMEYLFRSLEKLESDVNEVREMLLRCGVEQKLMPA